MTKTVYLVEVEEPAYVPIVNSFGLGNEDHAGETE